MLSQAVYEQLVKEREEIKKRLNTRGLDRHSLNYLNNRLSLIRTQLKDAHRDKYHRGKGA